MMADLKANKVTAKTTSAELSPATSYRGSASEDKGAELGTTEAQTPSGLDAVDDTAIVEEEAHDDPEIAQLLLCPRSPSATSFSASCSSFQEPSCHR